MIVCAYYTNPLYGEYTGRLKKSIPSGLDFHAEEFKDEGSWLANLHLKAKFIRRLLDDYPTERILYLDADSEVVGDISMLSTVKEDVAAVLWEHVPRSKPQLLGGTLLFRNTPAALEVLDRWALLSGSRKDRLDQENLEDVIEFMRGRVSVRVLSPEYCWLEKPMRPFLPDASPIIFHFGLGRENLKLKGYGS